MATFFTINGKKPNIRFHLYKALSTETVSKELFTNTIIPSGQFATRPFISELVLKNIICIKMQILWFMMKKTHPPQTSQNSKSLSATQDLIFSGIPVLFFMINPSAFNSYSNARGTPKG